MSNRNEPIAIPPRLATRFLRWYCLSELVDEVEGDLYELFQRRVEEQGLWKAKVLYWINVLMFLHPDYIRKRKVSYSQNHTAMFRNYFKIGWRNLYHDKFFSLINIFGLALGLSCSIFILLWVLDELSWDRFHTKIDRTYRVYMNRPGENGIFTQTVVPLALWEPLKTETGIKYITPTDDEANVTLEYEDQVIEKSFHIVGEDFLRMFDFKLLEGRLDEQLDDPSSIVLTESTARALFGSEQALGKAVRMNNQVDLKVSGIVEDPPHNSTLQFECLVPFKVMMSLDPAFKEELSDWGSASYYLYIALEDGVNPEVVEANIRDMLKPYREESELILFPLERSRLYSEFQNGESVGGAIVYVRIFTIVALLILALACINFANLTTARSEKRAKEVGIRKTVGSSRWQLIVQFLSETMIITFFSFGVAMIMVQVLLPLYNNLVNKNLSLDYGKPELWIAAIVFIVVTGFVAGSYPAFFLSSSRPLAVLKGKLGSGKRGSLLRKVMVTMQFFFSIGLMICTGVIYSQIHYIKDRDIGYNKDNLLMVSTTGEIEANYELIKRDLLSQSLASSVSVSSSPITNIRAWSKPKWQGQSDEQQDYFAIISVGRDYTQTLGAEVLQGRDFDQNFNDSSSILLNQAAVEYMGLDDPIGQNIWWSDREYTVVGVLDDVVMTSPYEPSFRTLFVFNPEWTSDMLIRLPRNESVSNMIKGIEEVFKKHNPAFPFSYAFVDEEFNRKFATEELIGKLARIFAILAVVISCLGLIGLSAFAAERRTKEIGIRKVLGASVMHIVTLLSREFIKLVLIALLMAAPLSWYIMDQWLQNFAYKTEIGPEVFLSTGLIAMMIAQLTVSWQSIKAAFTNPVDSLRNE